MNKKITKTFINAKYKDKDVVKFMGAKWDDDRKKWYVMSDNPSAKSLIKSYGKVWNSYEEYKASLPKDYIDKTVQKAIRARGYKSKKVNKYINKILGSYTPSVRHLKHVRYDQKDIIAIGFDKGNYSLKKIQSLSDKFSQYLQSKGLTGDMMTTLLYGNMGWRSGYLRAFGDEVELYDPDIYYDNANFEKPGKIDAFYIYVKLGNKPVGGFDDKYNDCLYRCLKYYIFDIENIFQSPEEFKRFLGLKRNEKIHIDLIDKVEKKLTNYQINVRGDYIRTSTIKTNKQINLILTNEHYEVEMNKSKPNLTPLMKYVEKIPIMYDKVSFEGYDGTTKWVLTKKERNDILYNPKSMYILIRREVQKDENNQTIHISIEEEYHKFILIANELKKASKGLINLYKSGSYLYSALDLFDRTTKYLNAETIAQDEAIWIKSSSIANLIWAEPFEGELYKYDVKSFFPYLLKQTTNAFPIKRGEFKQIDKLNDILEFGIYRCDISFPENMDTTKQKLFRINPKKYYTQLDIYHARKLNLNISLIIDKNKPNFLHYTPDKLIKFGEVFKPFIEIMFKLKESKINKAKDILNMLWGGLSEVDKRKYYTKENTYDYPDDEEIQEIYPTKNGLITIKTTSISHHYKTPYARLKPFLLSKSRAFISNLMMEYRDDIKRIQTDGFYTTKPIHYNKDVGLGELKYEGYTEHGIIKNKTNKVEVHY